MTERKSMLAYRLNIHTPSQPHHQPTQAGPLLEPVISILVAKLGDGQARIRDAALAGLLAMAKYVSLLGSGIACDII